MATVRGVIRHYTVTLSVPIAVLFTEDEPAAALPVDSERFKRRAAAVLAADYGALWKDRDAGAIAAMIDRVEHWPGQDVTVAATVNEYVAPAPTT